MKQGKYRYILGTSSFEVRRLRFQAGLWEGMTEALFDRLKVGPGWHCLEVGAGIGSVLLPLAERVRGRGGRVDAIERSPKYAAFLRSQMRRRGLSHVRLIEADLRSAALPSSAYDLIFARWVFLFIPEVEAHLRLLLRALKPGGLLAVEDYHRSSMAVYPPLPHWKELILADAAWFASQGGDVNVGGRLPQLYRKVGLKLVDLTPNIKVGGPESDVWKWAEAYFTGYLDQMAQFKPFTSTKAARFRTGWMRAKRTPGSIFISPTVLDVVGRKPIRA